MIKAIVFDLDDTLYPEKAYVDSGFRAVDYYLTEEKSVSGFYSKASDLFKSGKRGFIFNETLDSLSISYSEAFILELVDVYRNHIPSINLSDDSKNILQWASNNFKVGLITDGYKNAQSNKIIALAISKYFDSICITDELGSEFWKPSEKPYLIMQKSLGADAHQCIYVGDNPKKDFITPNKLGWSTVQIIRESAFYAYHKVGEGYRANFQITNLSELQQLVKET